MRQSFLAIQRNKYSVEHPFNQPSFMPIEFPHRQFQKQPVPSFMQSYLQRRTGNSIFIFKGTSLERSVCVFSQAGGSNSSPFNHARLPL